MKYFKLLVTVSSIMIVAACNTTGGTIGGLFPAPKFLEGDIENSIYVAKDSLFSISTPHKEDSSEYRYMQIKEQYKTNEAYVSFGPSGSDQNIYRVEVHLRPQEHNQETILEDSAQTLLINYTPQLQNAYGTEPEVVKTEKVKINDSDSIHYELTQHIPAGKYMSNSSAEFAHYVYVIDYKIGVAIIWVQVPEPPMFGDDLEPQDFAKSLKLLPNK